MATATETGKPEVDYSKLSPFELKDKLMEMADEATKTSAATSSSDMYEKSATSRFTPVDSSTGVRNPLVSASPARNSD